MYQTTEILTKINITHIVKLRKRPFSNKNCDFQNREDIFSYHQNRLELHPDNYRDVLGITGYIKKCKG